jgi:hypothetical protein
VPLVVALLLLAVLAPAADAYRLMKVVPQPVLRYHVTVKDWRKPMARAVRAVNREHVGVRLVKARIPQNASIQVGRLEKRCGLAGVDATTQTLEGGYAAIYLPYGCHGVQASIIAAHELGHALGLAHENRRCALMNSSGTGPKSIPTQCLGGSHPWLRRPFRRDDIKGLRRAYRNHPPRLSLTLDGSSGGTAFFTAEASDRDGNLSQIAFDYGDGARETVTAGEAMPASHAYGAPGTYRITATARDFYGKRRSASVTVTV